ncbi:hypothetical protein ACHAXS_007090 [Conticribra weissflogii]
MNLKLAIVCLVTVPAAANLRGDIHHRELSKDTFDWEKASSGEDAEEEYVANLERSIVDYDAACGTNLKSVVKARSTLFANEDRKLASKSDKSADSGVDAAARCDRAFVDLLGDVDIFTSDDYDDCVSWCEDECECEDDDCDSKDEKDCENDCESDVCDCLTDCNNDIDPDCDDFPACAIDDFKKCSKHCDYNFD